MQTFLVGLEKINTPEDIEKGAISYKSAKNILVQCEDESHVDNEIEKFKAKDPKYRDFKCVNVQDWDALQQAQTMANIQWILNR